MKRSILPAALVCLAGIAAYFLFAPDRLRPFALKSEFERYCLQCEEILSDRLRSPSSYIRTECSGPYTELATVDSYLEHDQMKDATDISEWTQRDIASGELRITTAYLKYEAANAYGTLIAGIQVCTQAHREGRSFVSESVGLGPHLGGYSSVGWAIHQLSGS